MKMRIKTRYKMKDLVCLRVIIETAAEISTKI